MHKGCLETVRISSLTTFERTPFRTYFEDELLSCLDNIKKGCAMGYIFCRTAGSKNIEILSGHSWVWAADLVDRSEVQVYRFDAMTDNEAVDFIVKENLERRTFNGLLPSERAFVVGHRHSKLSAQGKRNDLTSSPVSERRFTAIEKIGLEFQVSKNTVARLLRIDKLNEQLKVLVDEKKIPLRAGVTLSYLTSIQQEVLISKDISKITMADADKLLNASAEQNKFLSAVQKIFC